MYRSRVCCPTIDEEQRRMETKEKCFKKSETEATRQLEKNPADYIVKWMKTGFSLNDKTLREKFSVFKNKVREGLKRIFTSLSFKEKIRRLKEKLMSCVEFSLEARKEMICYIYLEIANLQFNG